MTIGEMLATIKFQVDKGSEKSVQNSAMQLKSLLRKAVGVVGISLSVAGLKDLAATAAEFKAMDAQFNQTFEGIEENARNSLNAVAEYGGMATSRLKSSFTSLAAFAKTGGMGAAESVEFASDAMKVAADSAAYFDRSIEETADIMKRLMKGNFTLDDNLGFQSTQATRDAMAAELHAIGKVSSAKYQQLDSYEQQLVILNQIKKANDDMGATGQAQKEAKEWTNMVGNMSAYMKELKAGIGRLALPFALKIVTRLSDILKKVTEWTNKMVDSLGDFEKEGTTAYRLLQKFDRILSTLQRGIRWVVDGFKKFVNIIGGTKNALLLLSAIIAGIGIATFLDKLSAAGGLIGILKKAVTGLNIPFLLTIAAVVVLFAIIQDLVYFVQGKKSLLGKMLEDAGFSPTEINEIRLAMRKAAEAVKDFFTVANEQDPEGSGIVKLIRFLKDNEGLTLVLGTIAAVIAGMFNPLAGIVFMALNLYTHFVYIKKKIDEIQQAFADWEASKGFQDFCKAFDDFFNSVPGKIAEAIINFPARLMEAGLALLEGDFKRYFDLVFKNGDLQAFPSVSLSSGKKPRERNSSSHRTGNVYDKMNDTTAGDPGIDFTAVSDASKKMAENVSKDSESVKKDVSDMAASTSQDLTATADGSYGHGLDMIHNFADGIGDGIDYLQGKVSAAANVVWSWLHHSTPEEGPLADDDIWGFDMITNFADGIEQGKDMLRSAVGSAAAMTKTGMFNTLSQGAAAFGASSKAWSNYTGGATINQTNNFINTFNGADMRVASDAQRRNNNDATKQLANALVGGR